MRIVEKMFFIFGGVLNIFLNSFKITVESVEYRGNAKGDEES